MKNSFARFLKARQNSHNSYRFPRKPLDEFLEYLRFIKVAQYIPREARILDVGAGDGTFLRFLEGHLQHAEGIEAHIPDGVVFERYRLIPGYFPHDFDSDTPFDVITMLAVAEHILMSVYPDVVKACWRYLTPKGRVIITVQHPRVEGFLDLLKSLQIVEGFSMHEHYGFNPECLLEFFNAWKLVKRERWGFGCNNLFIFEKTET